MTADLALTLHDRMQSNLVGPAQHMCMLVHAEQIACVVKLALHRRAVTGPYGLVSDGVVIARQEAVFCQIAVQHIKQTLDLHRIAVDQVLELGGRVRIEMSKVALMKENPFIGQIIVGI